MTDDGWRFERLVCPCGDELVWNGRWIHRYFPFSRECPAQVATYPRFYYKERRSA